MVHKNDMYVTDDRDIMKSSKEHRKENRIFFINSSQLGSILLEMKIVK